MKSADNQEAVFPTFTTALAVGIIGTEANKGKVPDFQRKPVYWHPVRDVRIKLPTF
jgi:hypothetical protein